MIWRSDQSGKCDYFNRTWLEFRGKTLEEESGDGWTKGIHPEDTDYCLGIYLESFHKRKPFKMVYRLMRYDGRWRWIEDTGVPYYDNAGNFLGYIGSCIDVTERVEGERLKDIALKDGLTGTLNRSYFEQLLNHEFNKAKQYKTKLSLIMLDIDNFKSINDRYGHLVGDESLKILGEVIRSNVRKDDMVGRYGGDEILIMLPGTGIDEAFNIAERIRLECQKSTVTTAQANISLSSSIGVVEFTAEDNFGDLIEKADKAMYFSKKSGGNISSKFSGDL